MQKIKTINRYKCLVSKSKLQNLFTFKNFPVFMGVTDENIKKDIYADMKWVISKKSGFIQLKKLIPLEILYKTNHSSGLVGNIWRDHHKQFAKLLSTINPKSVLEIGGQHGILFKEFSKLNSKIKWMMIEPAPEKKLKSNNLTIIKNFFEKTDLKKLKYDVIVHSHVFEHIYNPEIFLKKINTNLSNGKYHIFSIPNMQEMLKRKYTNCLDFEHSFFMTEPYVEYFLKKNKLKIIKKKYFKKDHSIFYITKKENETEKNPQQKFSNLYLKNKDIFLEFILYYKKIVNKINLQIKETSCKNIYLFGAHGFSQYLIAFGLKTKKIKFILDNDKNKQGKRLYGTRLIVKSPKILKKIDKAIVILKAGIYTKEIKQDISKNINSKIRYL
jgi:2-polyprenyl-3-methyl-5-hydroxy-6-metoxy-1,4-benzoquinol methylase